MNNPEIVGRLCTPTQKMKAIKAYKKTQWVDGLLDTKQSEPGMYTVDLLIRLTDHEEAMELNAVNRAAALRRHKAERDELLGLLRDIRNWDSAKWEAAIPRIDAALAKHGDSQ